MLGFIVRRVLRGIVALLAFQFLLDRAPRTLLLFLTAAALSYVLGIWLGKIVAWRRGGLFEFGALSVGVAAHTSFAPWLAFLGLGLFAWNLRWLPYQNLINFNVWLRVNISLDEILLRLVISGFALFGVFLLTRLIGRKGTQGRRAIGAGIFLLAFLLVAAPWDRSGYSPLAVDVLQHLILPLGS